MTLKDALIKRQTRTCYFNCRKPRQALEWLSWPGSVIGLTRRPLKAETTGSIPVRATTSLGTDFHAAIPTLLLSMYRSKVHSIKKISPSALNGGNLPILNHVSPQSSGPTIGMGRTATLLKRFGRGAKVPLISKTPEWQLSSPLTLLLAGYFTVSVSMVLWLNEPEVPVKVRV
jgi:hypothetical protein